MYKYMCLYMSIHVCVFMYMYVLHEIEYIYTSISGYMCYVHTCIHIVQLGVLGLLM